MPKAWSAKRERQYEHIKESEQDRGKSTKRAKSIAAATVNKQRRKSGETKRDKAAKSLAKKRAKNKAKKKVEKQTKK